MDVSHKTRGRQRVLHKKTTTDFSNVGGLSHHIEILREIVIFPLLYKELYNHFGVKAPKGVLFHGPPGKFYISRSLVK